MVGVEKRGKIMQCLLQQANVFILWKPRQVFATITDCFWFSFFLFYGFFVILPSLLLLLFFFFSETCRNCAIQSDDNNRDVVAQVDNDAVE